MPKRRRTKTKMVKKWARKHGVPVLGEVTKRDFVAIAAILCETRASKETRERLAGYFGSQNPRFQTGRFLAATGKC